MSKVVHEAKPARYVVEFQYQGPFDVDDWVPAYALEDLSWAKEYANSKASKKPEYKWRVVDTEAEDA